VFSFINNGLAINYVVILLYGGGPQGANPRNPTIINVIIVFFIFN